MENKNNMNGSINTPQNLNTGLGTAQNYNRDDDELEIDLLQLLLALKRKIWLILLTGVLFAGAAFGITKFLLTPIYTSTSTMLVLTKETTIASLADLQLGSQLTKDYTVLIQSRPVLEEVIKNQRLDMDYKHLRKAITINNPDSTRILELSAEMTDPETAKDVVDELAEVSSEYIGEKMEVTPPKIIEDGELPTMMTSPNMQKNIILGFLLGAFLICAITVIFEILNDTIQNEEDIEKYLNVPVLAVVPDKAMEKGQKGKSKKKKRGGKR